MNSVVIYTMQLVCKTMLSCADGLTFSTIVTCSHCTRELPGSISVEAAIINLLTGLGLSHLGIRWNAGAHSHRGGRNVMNYVVIYIMHLYVKPCYPCADGLTL